MTQDPRDTLARNAMTRAQILVVAITVGLNALDGFDVLAISFASPGIAHDWGINRAALGVVLSMELIGMAIGSMLLGSGFLAPFFGREFLVGQPAARFRFLVRVRNPIAVLVFLGIAFL